MSLSPIRIYAKIYQTASLTYTFVNYEVMQIEIIFHVHYVTLSSALLNEGNFDDIKQDILILPIISTFELRTH